MATMKVIVTSKKNLQAKYGNDFPAIEALFRQLVVADRQRDLDTKIIYIDNTASAKKVGIKAVASVTRPSAKKAIDDIFKKHRPAYLVIFGSQDIIPFQELNNLIPNDPEEDTDVIVPSDLPYACDAPYGADIASFIGPTRVVGRIPDITGKGDIEYVKTLINTIIDYKSMDEEKFLDYFSVTAAVWKVSTRKSLNKIFGNSTKLKDSPPSAISYPAPNLKPLTHFYNCHGSNSDSKFYGELGNDFPFAMESTDLNGKISLGTVVAAECCYGAELYDPAEEDNQQLPICNAYLGNGAVVFVGSSTIAYGPPDGQDLADLITQYFIKNVLAGASTGSAFLDARQKFLSVAGSSPDAHELKTIAQFYLLGDPSIHPVAKAVSKGLGEDTVENRRLNMLNKGLNLVASINPCRLVKSTKANKVKPLSAQEKNIFKECGFTGQEKEVLFEVKPNSKRTASLETGMKKIAGSDKIVFRTFTRKSDRVIRKSDKPGRNFNMFDVLVLKESGGKFLGWKMYQRK